MDRLVNATALKRIIALGATALVVVLGLLPGVADARGASPAYPPVRPTKVLILGDSVMKGAATQYAVKLPGRNVVVDAEVNRSTGQGADVVARLGADWDVVVVLLGHNDGGTPGAYQPAARRILDQLRGVRRVVWLKIHEVRPYYPGVNQYIASLQSTYPNLRTADWNAIASAHPEALAGDGLHLNGQGADLMAGLVADQVHLAELDWYGGLKALARQATTTTTAPPTTTTTAAPTTTSTSTSTTSTPTTKAAKSADESTTTFAAGDVPGTRTNAKNNRSAGQVGPAIVVGMIAVWAGLGLYAVRRQSKKNAAAKP